MERRRLTLDNPVFEGKLRYNHRGSAYARRNLQPATIDDIITARAPKPKPKHAGTSAAAIHTAKYHQAPSARRQRVLAPVSPTGRNKARRFAFKKHHLLYAMAAVIFIAGAAVTVNGFLANRQVAAQVRQAGQQPAKDGAATSSKIPSTKKLSASVVRNYAVAPNLPRYIDIPALHVHARVLSEGIDRGGALDVPWNIYDTGWYNASAQPGQNGAMLIDGHSGVGIQHGVFHDLPSLRKGDSIVITRGDNAKFTYKVVSVRVVPLKKVDMASMLVSANTAKPGLNLITCAGDRVPGTTNLTDRALVRAVIQ